MTEEVRVSHLLSMADGMPDAMRIMALSGREAFFASLGKQMTKETDRTTEQWVRAAELVNGVVEREIICTWQKLAEDACRAHGTAWENEPVILRLAWEVAVRQMVNLRQAENSEEFTLCKASDWLQWTLKKLQEKS